MGDLSMIIASQFVDDPDWIQQIQHDMYRRVVSLPFVLAKDNYLKAESILDIKTSLGHDCRNMDGIDHRVLQYFHDSIATRFRYGFQDVFQMSLPRILEGNTEVEDIKRMWFHYFKEQIEFLFSKYQDLPQQVLIAGTYPNPDERGKDAEEKIYMTCLKMNSHIKKSS